MSESTPTKRPADPYAAERRMRQHAQDAFTRSTRKAAERMIRDDPEREGAR